MRKLLYADFCRMYKSPLFRVTILFMLGYGIFTVWDTLRLLAESEALYTMDRIMFRNMGILVWFIAVFATLFTGTDYRCGTIRNKLALGHNRVHIYLSNLLVSMTASVLFFLAYQITSIPLGLALLDGPTFSSAVLIGNYIGIFCWIFASCAKFCFFGMMIHISAFSITGALVYEFAILSVLQKLFYAPLIQPEFWWQPDGTVDEAGRVVSTLIPNEAYLTEPCRSIYDYILKTFPVTQSQYAYSSIADGQYLYMSVCALCIGGLILALGIHLFCKKDIF